MVEIIKSIIKKLHKEFKFLEDGLVVEKCFKYKVQFNWYDGESGQADMVLSEKKMWEILSRQIDQVEKCGNKRVAALIAEADKYADQFNIDRTKFFDYVMCGKIYKRKTND